MGRVCRARSPLATLCHSPWGSSAPRSRRQPPSPGRSFHHRFAIGENVHGFIKGIPSAAGHGEPSWDTYMAYILVLLLLHLLEWEVIVVLGVG